jgi:hypothetical protein
LFFPLRQTIIKLMSFSENLFILKQVTPRFGKTADFLSLTPYT